MTERVRSNDKRFADWLEELAHETHAYMIMEGMVKDSGSFLTVEQWALNFGFVKTDDEGAGTDDPRDMSDLWRAVKMEMIRQGYPVAVQEIRGHYIGEAGDEATNVLLQRNQIAGRSKTAKEYIEYFLTSTDPTRRGKFIEQLEAGLPEESNLADLLKVLDSVLETTGPLQLSIFRLYLDDGKVNDEADTTQEAA